MRRAAGLAAFLLLWSVHPGAGQDHPGAEGAPVPGMPDVPAGGATLRLRIEHDARPDAAAGLPVVLYALPAEGEPGLRGGVSDARGEVVFENVSADPETPYLVGVRFDEVPFGSRVRFAAGESELAVVLQISDPSPDTRRARLGEVELRFEDGCRGIQVIESWEVRNPGPRVIGVRESERAGRPPIFETRLPDAAAGFAPGPGAQGLELQGGRLAFWGPLHPGTQVIDWSYGMPGGARLERPFPGGATRVRVLARPGGPRVSGPGLAPGRPQAEPDGDWIASRAEPSDGRLDLGLEAGSGPASDGLALERAQLWVEVDDAALRVDERHEFEPVDGREASLLCVPLPAGAEELRFSGASLARDPSGDLAVRGPFPAGPFSLSLRYLLPRGAGPAELTRSFSLPLPLLSVYVADTGLRADSGRMHRRRPVLTDDRTYMHFEAFGLEPGEEVPLRLEPLPAGRRAPRPAVAAFLALSAAAALGFLAAPLRRRGAAPDLSPAPPESLERESLEAALGDLDHDFETGKLAAEDYEAFRAELGARVAALEVGRRARAAAPPADRCPGCGAAAPPPARFCSQCGECLPQGPGPAA